MTVGATRATWRDVFAVPEYRGLFAAQATSLIGDQLAKIAVAILVFRHTDSPFLAALTYAASLLPALVAGPLLGHLADTRQRRELMIGCDLVRAALIAVMLVPGLPVAILIGLLFVASAVDPPFNAARAALLPEVLTGERYPVGQSINGVASQTAQVVGFGLGGALVATLTPRGALGIDVASFLVSAALVRLTLARRPAPQSATGLSRWELVSSGTTMVLGDPLLRRLIGVTAASFGTIIATEGLAVSYAHEIGRGDVATGLLTAAVPVGSALGLVLVGRTPAARQVNTLRLLAVLWPLPLLATILRPGVAVTVALWALTGALSSYYLLGNVLFARALEAGKRGRAFAFAQSALVAVQGVGLLGVGAVADVTSPSVAVAVAGLVGLVCCGALALRLRDAGEASLRSSVPAETRRENDVVTSPPAGPLTGDGGVVSGGLTRHPGPPPARPEAAADRGVSGPRRVRVGAVYALSVAALVASAVLVSFSGWRSEQGAPVRVQWWMLLTLFAATGYFKVIFQRGRDAHSLAATQVALLLGLFFASPPSLLVGGVLGLSLVDVARRMPPLKLLANAATRSVEIVVCLAVVHLAGQHGQGASSHDLVVALVAVVAGDLVSALFITAIQRLFDAQVTVRGFLWPLAFGLVVSLIAGMLGLIAVAAMFANSSTVAFLLIMAILTAAGVKAIGNLQQRHVDLGQLYAFQENLGALVPRGPSMFPVLEHARELLHAESVSLYLQDDSSPRDRRHELRVHVDFRPQELFSVDEAEAGVGTPPTEMTVELRVEGRHLGRLVVRRRLGRVRGFQATDLKLLETLGAQVSDALERGTLLEQLQIAATHDPLTGLLTLGEFMVQLDDALVRGTPYVLMLLDVAGLKDVNDSLGHDAGDALLQRLGQRLEAMSPAGTLLARSGGGEFAVAVKSSAVAGEAVAASVMQIGNALVQVLGVTVELRTRLGWLALTADAADAATGVRRADLALAHSKAGTGRAARYASHMDVDGLRRLRLVNDLRDAVANHGLKVVYQPLVTPADGRVVGAEALVRWRHPEFGNLSPDEFIPIAEQSGVIAELTRVVLDTALAQTRRWHDTGRPLRVAVNLSARCLSDLSLPGDVVDMLARHRLDPEFLTLEVTETSVAEDPVRALAVLHRLRGVGVRLSIDDFGTGYSSLAALKRFPVQEVKLDRQFLSELGTGADANDVSLVSAVVALGHSLDLEIVAEGVETAAAYDRLRRLGVDVLQGYYIGRPAAGGRLRTAPIHLGAELPGRQKKPGTQSRAPSDVAETMLSRRSSPSVKAPRRKAG